MQKKRMRDSACIRDAVFMPALTPLEAAVLPAKERNTQKGYGVLRMVRYACDAGESGRTQRAKIWVR